MGGGGSVEGSLSNRHCSLLVVVARQSVSQRRRRQVENHKFKFVVLANKLINGIWLKSDNFFLHHRVQMASLCAHNVESREFLTLKMLT